jgi:AraC-like DNA-binding protein
MNNFDNAYAKPCSSTDAYASALALRSEPAPRQRGTSLLLQALFADADRLIRRDYADMNLTPREIARRLRCSRATLYRAFHVRCFTVAGYLRQVRLEEVCLQLSSAAARVPISTIAMNCGLECLRAFNRIFKAEYGMTAGRYRREVAGSIPHVSTGPGLASSGAPSAESFGRIVRN